MSTESGNEFEKASQRKQGSLIGEFLGYLKDTKKFWLLPFILVLLALSALLVLTNSALAPFIYTLF